MKRTLRAIAILIIVVCTYGALVAQRPRTSRVAAERGRSADVGRQNRSATDGPASLARASTGGAPTAHDGLRQQQLTARRIWVTGPAEQPMGPPSLDGRILPYTDWFSGDLATLNLATGEKRRLTGSPTLHQSSDYSEGAAPSPDGRRIAYMWSESELRLIDAEGGEPRVLLKADYPEPRAWSPDGSQIAVVAERPDGTVHLMLVSPDDGRVRNVKSFGWNWPDGAFFSPDGRFLAYTVKPLDGASGKDIFVISTDATRETLVVHTPADDEVWGWTPGGDALLYVSHAEGTTPSLSLQPMEGGRPSGEPRLVKPGMWQASPLGLTRDGRLYYSVGAALTEIVVANVGPDGLASDHTIRLSEGLTPNRGRPVWSADGKRIAFIVLNGQDPQGRSVVVVSLESGERHEFKLPDPLSPPQDLEWAPDGRSLTVLATDRKARQRAIYRIDAQTGAFDVLVCVRNATNETEWSPDGRTLYYAEREWPAASIIARRMDTGAVDTIHFTTDNAKKPRDIALSPDGRNFAMQLWFRDRIEILPVTGGTPRVLVKADDGEWLGLVAWSADGGRLIYSRTLLTDGSSSYWTIPVDGGAAKPFLSEATRVGSIGYSPDGRRAVMRAEQGAREVWVIEGLPGAAETARSAAKE